MLKMFKKNKGFTLVELTVAVALFAVTIVSAMNIFKFVAEGQRNAIAAQNIQASMRYALEVISKEIRMAKKSNAGECGATSTKVYFSAAGQNLKFKNNAGECVEYSLVGNRFQIDRNGTAGFVTPDEIKVSNLKFIIKDISATTQPMVTMVMDVEMAAGSGMHKQPMKIQTTISSRYYGG